MRNENCIWYLVLSIKYNEKFKITSLNRKTQNANVKTTW